MKLFKISLSRFSVFSRFSKYNLDLKTINGLRGLYANQNIEVSELFIAGRKEA